MIVEGTALVIAQDNVDTDVLYPGRFLNVLEPAEMTRHLFEGLDPSLRDRLTDSTVLVAGANFGTGSSRENVPTAMRAAGIRCVVAPSFARIFHRNCFNLGLPAIASAGAATAAHDGSAVRVEIETGEITVDGAAFHFRALPPFMVDLLRQGGLEPWVVGRLEKGSDG